MTVNEKKDDMFVLLTAEHKIFNRLNIEMFLINLSFLSSL